MRLPPGAGVISITKHSVRPNLAQWTRALDWRCGGTALTDIGSSISYSYFYLHQGPWLWPCGLWASSSQACSDGPVSAAVCSAVGFRKGPPSQRQWRALVAFRFTESWRSGWTVLDQSSGSAWVSIMCALAWCSTGFPDLLQGAFAANEIEDVTMQRLSRKTRNGGF